jgi:hypothetical protein
MPEWNLKREKEPKTQGPVSLWYGVLRGLLAKQKCHINPDPGYNRLAPGKEVAAGQRAFVGNRPQIMHIPSVRNLCNDRV